MSFHKDKTLDDNHATPARVYDDIAARDADTDFQVTENIDKEVRVDTPIGYFSLVSVGPAVFTEKGNASATTFTGLTDTPANFIGEESRNVQVNTGATALEYSDTKRLFGTTDPDGSITGAGGDEFNRNEGGTSGSYESLEVTTGTNWFKRVVNPPTIIAINNSEQFEEQATASVITITTNTCFVIHATFTTSTRFVINSGVTLRITAEPAVNPFILTYSGTGDFFSGAGNVIINGLQLSASAASTLVDIDGGSFTIERSLVSGFPTLGTVANGSLTGFTFTSFASIGAGLSMTNMELVEIFGVEHSGTGLTTPFFTYSTKLANTQMSMTIVNLRLGTGGSVIDISTDVNDLAPMTFDRVTTVTGDLFKQTTVSDVAITVVADASIANGTITAMADNSDGGTTISSTATYFDGELITISGTTSYNGSFRIFNIVASTSFDIQVVFVADDATGTTVTERIGLTVGGGHGVVATDSIKVKDTNFYNGFNTVLIAGATLITINGDFISTNTGNIERDVSLDQSDPRVKGAANAGTPRSENIACAHVNDNSTANGAIVNNTFTDMVFGTAGAGLLASSTMERWILKDELNGTFEYIGLESFQGSITFDFTVISSTEEDFRFKWQKSTDGGSSFSNLDDDVEAVANLKDAGDNITKTFPLKASSGDQIKPQITRNAGSATITTTYATIYVANPL